LKGVVKTFKANIFFVHSFYISFKNVLVCLFILVSKYAAHEMCMYNSAEMYKAQRIQEQTLLYIYIDNIKTVKFYIVY
jgi:hypothetical protein